MTKNLSRIKKDLKSFAKRVKDFKYTDKVLVMFLLTGTIGIENNLFSAQTTDTAIENQIKQINTSVHNFEQNLKKTKDKNNKSIKQSNLELIQLMEQGDHVIKSTWSNWQYGVNEFYNNWDGTYKGKGDKSKKYPYEGIFERDSNEFNRYISPESLFYGYLPKLTNSKYASTNLRTGIISEYGIASYKDAKEPIVTVELTAGIKPKAISRAPLSLQPKVVNTPEFPEVVRFSAINPNINIPSNPSLPSAPVFQLFLGPDSNVGTSPLVGGTTFVNRLTDTNFLATDNRSKQNIRTQLRYTLDSNYTGQLGFPTSLITVAFKLWMDDGGAFGMYEVESDSNGKTKRGTWHGGGGAPPYEYNANNYINPFNNLPDKIYFNSYNFSYNGGNNEYSGPIGDSTVGGNTQNYNNQRFLVGGSRFIEIDNKGKASIDGCVDNCSAVANVTLPANKTLYLSGPLTLGMVSQENGVIFRNNGKITDEGDNSSMKNIKTMIGSQIKQVGMAQENVVNDITKVTLENAAGAEIALSGDQSTGMYAKRGIIKNSGKINVGKDSTGIYLVEDNGAVGVQGATVTNESTGLIKIGENSTGIYYKAEGTGANTGSNGGVINNGKIESSSNNVIGMTFENPISGTNRVLKNTASGVIDLQGDKSTGMYATGTGVYTAVNDGGTIKLGNSSNADSPNAGMFTDKPFITLENKGTIDGGNKAVGIYGYNINVDSGSLTKIGTGGTAIYSKGGNININGGTITAGADNAVGIYYTGNGGTITNNATVMNIGDNSFGFVIKNDVLSGGNTLHSNTSNVNVGSNTVYIYSNDKSGHINNNTNLTSTGNENYGIYSAGSVTNTGNISFLSGIGNVGIYSSNGGTATNNGVISIGASDISPENLDDRRYALGMAAGYKTSDTGTIINNGTINVNGNDSIGMYATGEGSIARNNVGATINLGADGAIGMYLDEKAKGYNDGVIQTTPGTKPNVAIGVVVRKGATLYNTGTIHIVSDGGIAMFNARGGIIHNTGTIILGTSGAAENRERETGTPGSDTSKEAGAIKIRAPKGAAEATITVNGIPVTPEAVTLTVGERDMLTSSLGMYIDTLRGTNPIKGLSTVTDSADLIIGTEATKVSNSKYIKVSDEILKPYNDTIDQSGITNWNIYSGSLTWMATATLGGPSGYINNLYLAKRPYTEFAGNEMTPVNSLDTYNFLDGLEQRYGIESLDSREKQLFLKLNNIGKNEEILFYQATDEMMGHQYGNLQQRINATGGLLDKEFKYLKHDWRNPSKQNNKIKVFGMRDEYNTDTAGIINYTSNAYGVAYVHEDEKVKMGNSRGWYAGAVTNRFKFKDIGKSKENQTILKAGVFKTMSPKKDYNGALQWTIGGDVFVGINDMKRRYLVVDDVFQAKSDYHSYGAALKTDLGYDVRLGERTHFRPYGALKMEYGRFNSIKEDRGEMRLEVKGNDYFSVKPEIGMEFKYVQPLAVRTNLTVGLTAAYENELGKVGDVNNKARVRYTTADWFGIRGEKEDRKGNGKFDLNVGVDNTRFGVTVNAGYDTKGSNVRGGIGVRLIY